MAFINGELVFDNTGGVFDAILEDSIYDVLIYYLDAKKGLIDYERSELVPLTSLYVENYEHSIEEFTASVQDQRKAHNTDLLQTFYEDNPVPIIYGPIKAITAKMIDDTYP